MTTLKMKVTLGAAARSIAELMRDYFTGDSMPVTIGLMADGTVGRRHNVHGLDDMAIPITDTEGGWNYGDWGGDPADESTWTDAALDALAEGFAAGWIADAIRHHADSEYHRYVIYSSSSSDDDVPYYDDVEWARR